MMNRMPVNLTAPPITKKPQTGLLEARVGANFPFRAGSNQEIRTVKEKRLFHKAKCVCRCLRCLKEWPTYEALAADHPSSQQMAQLGETHVWCWWSGDLADKDDPRSQIGPLSETL